MKRRIFAYILIAAGVLLCADTLILLAKTASRSLGIFMPFVLGVPLCIAGICELFRPSFLKNIFGKLLRIICVTGYGAFLLLFALTTTLSLCAGHAKVKSGADCLIVLGCGVQGTHVTLTLANRLDRAIEYLNDNPQTLVIVSGGQGQHEDISEAQAMHDYLVRRGVADERIILEDRSESTEENFDFSKEIIDERFGEDAKVVFVTTYFHVFRAEGVAKKHGLNADGIGAPGVWYITFNDYLRECVGITIYTLKGRI